MPLNILSFIWIAFTGTLNINSLRMLLSYNNTDDLPSTPTTIFLSFSKNYNPDKFFPENNMAAAGLAILIPGWLLKG